MKNAKQLKDDDIEKVTGGTGVDLEFKPMEVDKDNKNPMVNNDPFESNSFTDEGTPDW